MYDKLLPLKEAIVDGLSGPAQRFHERQFDFFKKITAVSGQIKDFPKGPLRKNACSKALQVDTVRSTANRRSLRSDFALSGLRFPFTVLYLG